MSVVTEKLRSAGHPQTEDLRRVSMFADLLSEDLEWLAQHMLLVEFGTDEIFVQEGEPADYMAAILDGEVRSELSNGRFFMVEAGQVTGMIPYSRLTTYPGTARTSQPTRVAVLHKDLFAEMLNRLPLLQSRMVRLLADRVRAAAVADEQRAKMAALGQLSAGLAHELNNPAAAAKRAASNLRTALMSVRSAALRLDRGGMPQEARIFLAELEFNRKAAPAPLDELERSDHEDEISSWLRRHGHQAGWDIVSALVEIGCTVEALEEVAQHVPHEFFSDSLVRMTAAFTITQLTEQIESATARMSDLVKAIKEYSYMDRGPVQDIDIHDGLENTLIMLNHRLKRGVEVSREYDRSLPRVEAHGSELNQIWTNLIVNAVDAMQEKGLLKIRTLRDHNCAQVEVVDNGPGIPDEIKAHIFEPFFTTKPVGEGTGLGLDVVYRIIRVHGGDIRVDSRPKETRFVVRIPFRSKALAASTAATKEMAGQKQVAGTA